MHNSRSRFTFILSFNLAIPRYKFTIQVSSIFSHTFLYISNKQPDSPLLWALWWNWESFVGIVPQKQDFRPLAGLGAVLRSNLHKPEKRQCILLYFSKQIFQRMKCTFPVRFQRIFILFRWCLARMLPITVAKKPQRGILFFAFFESNKYSSKANACFIRT